MKQLRYGHLMIMTDQDHDGSHIKGLIMNYFHTFYPSLMRLPGFLIEFITPVIKVSIVPESLQLLLCRAAKRRMERCNWTLIYLGILQHGSGAIMWCTALPTLSGLLCSSYASQQAMSW